MNLAAQAEGRVIRLTFSVKFTPPNTDDVGDTDVAMAIGKGLIREAMLMLKNAGEAEGFAVDIEAHQVSY